ncbi:MAG: alkaline phosphatase family protein [Bryobacteraceae bacterium]
MPAIDKIKHLVVLMMENRSFDHMFGFLAGPGYPIDGLTGNESNPDSQGQNVTVSRDAAISGELTPDPGHHFPDVNFQLFSNFLGPQPAVPAVPMMQGFVKAYEQHTHDRNKSHRIMKCFDHSKLPFLTTLAKEYAVCDRWFSSVPGPTLPNRSYAHAATSIGRVDMNPIWRDETTTIYELLDKFGVSARIYYHDWSIALTFKQFANSQGKWFGIYDDFERACKKGTLPAYSFIEPRYNDSDQGENGVFEASDQHPDHNITEGDRLIGDVYKAIRSNQELWENTLLVITYDEHGGTYDHVVPPATVNPDNRNADKPGENVADIPPFDFTRLGVRVPAVIVSPYIERGTIDSVVYDHTSFLGMARKLFLGNAAATNFLTARDRQANTFEHVLTRDIARIDQVDFKQPDVSFDFNPMAAAAVPNSLDKPLSVHQRDLVEQAFQAEQALPPERRSGIMTPNQILTERQASVYLQQVANALRGERPAAATGV